MNEQTKICTGCNETKDVSCFYKDKKASDGLCFRCKDCNKAASKAYREANRDKTVACARTYREANKDKMRARNKAHNQTQRGKYRTYKWGAKQRSLPFELTFDEFMIFWQANCHYCGDQIATIGIDRIDSSVGYTLTNCVSCCWECNRVKGDRPNEALNTHMLKMLKHQGII